MNSQGEVAQPNLHVRCSEHGGQEKGTVVAFHRNAYFVRAALCHVLMVNVSFGPVGGIGIRGTLRTCYLRVWEFESPTGYATTQHSSSNL